MNRDDLSEIYRGYIDCLNQQNWPGLGTFVHYNGRPVGLSGYRGMLERDFDQIPDIRCTIVTEDEQGALERLS